MTNEISFGRYTDEDVARMIDDALEEQRSAALVAAIFLCLPSFLMGTAVGFFVGWVVW